MWLTSKPTMADEMHQRCTAKASIAPSTQAITQLETLDDMQRRFSVLQGKMDVLESLKQQIRGWNEWNECLDGHWEKQRDAILTEMCTIAWSAEKSASRRLADCRAKAHILLEWCVTDDGDIVHSLAASLCNDLRDITESNTVEQGHQESQAATDRRQCDIHTSIGAGDKPTPVRFSSV